MVLTGTVFAYDASNNLTPYLCSGKVPLETDAKKVNNKFCEKYGFGIWGLEYLDPVTFEPDNDHKGGYLNIITFKEKEIKPKLRDANAPAKVQSWLAGLGDASNIITVDACAQTRLRLKLQDPTHIDEQDLKTKGIEAVVHFDDNLIHLLVGLNSDQYAAEMNAQLAAK